MFEELTNKIDSHEACENDFFAMARQKRWSFEQLVTFAPEYYYFTKSFPGALAGLISNVTDEYSRFFLIQILYSELGSGLPDETHSKLFFRTLRALGMSTAQIDSAPRFQETSDLVDGMRRLYRDENILKAIGAQYALERQAFPMIEKLYVGFKHFDHIASEDLKYFDLHLDEEPEHLACMEECISRHVFSPDDVQVVVAGATECLDFFSAFWRRLFAEISA